MGVLDEEYVKEEEEQPDLSSFTGIPAAAPPSSFLSKFSSGFTTTLAQLCSSVWKFFMQDVVDPLLDRLFDGLKKHTDYEEKAWEYILTQLSKNGVADKETVERLLKFKNIPGILQSLFNIITMGNLLLNYTRGASDAILSPAMRKLNAEFSPQLPDASALINASFIAPEKTEEIRKTLRQIGLSEEHIDLMFIARYQLYDVDTTRQLFLRKEIDEDRARERMREMGFTDTRIDEMMKLWTIIPPVQDILTMVAKEAFEPDQVELFGLNKEFPEAQSEWLTKMGLSRFWQEKYWAAHWDYPGSGQVLDMLHRGLITEAEVDQFYRVIEMPTYWREKLMKISYNPYTRVDTRRMHQMGVLTDEELVQAYEDQGYSHEKALKMAEFTIRYNAESYKKISEAKIMNAYKDKLLSTEEVHSLLEPMKYRTEHVDFLIEMADFDEVMEMQKLYLKNLETRYVNNLIDEYALRNELGKANLPAKHIELLIEKWTTAKMLDIKMPSKTDLDKFLRNKVINEDIYKREMYKLGYSFEQVGWYMQLVNLNKAG